MIEVVQQLTRKYRSSGDTGILRLARGKYLVLTDDFRLSQYLQKMEIDVLNFNHIRPLGWT